MKTKLFSWSSTPKTKIHNQQHNYPTKTKNETTKHIGILIIIDSKPSLKPLIEIKQLCKKLVSGIFVVLRIKQVSAWPIHCNSFLLCTL